MLKAIIVEDEKNLLDLFSFFIKDNGHYELIGCFSNPEKALQEIPKLAPDVVFLDIEMPKMNGIELASRLKSDQFQFVFTTAYEEYALDALKLEASEYLLKPILPEQLEAITPKLLKKFVMLQQYRAQLSNEKSIYVQCFGSFTTVTQNGQAIKWPTRKVEELFAYLLIHHECITNKWRLADDLWPNKGLNNIYNSVYLLNKTFKEYGLPFNVVNMNEGYKLEIDPSIEIDLLQFESFPLEEIGSPKALVLVNAISQRGVLFQDKDYSWVTLYREQYTIKHKKLLDSLLHFYKSKDPIIFEGLLKDYHLLYND